MIGYIFPLLTIFSRGSLNIFDRYQLKKSPINIALYIFMNCLITAFFGAIITCLAGKSTHLFKVIVSFESIGWALILHFASYQFTKNLRLRKIREFLLVTKLGDMLLAPLAIVILCQLLPSKWSGYFPNDFKLFSFVIVLCALLLAIRSIKNFRFFADIHALVLIGIIVFQTIMAVFFKSYHSKYDDPIWHYWLLAIAVICWRTVISLILYLYVKITSKSITGSFFSNISIQSYILRSILMLFSYASFMLTMQYTNPIISFPIINASPLLALLLANICLKESFYKRDLFAMMGLVLSALA